MRSGLPAMIDHMEQPSPHTVSRAATESRKRFLEFPVEPGMVGAVSNGSQSSMLLPHTVPQWPDRMQAGFVFTFTARTGPKTGARGSSWLLWATVEVTAACAHRRIAHIQDCKARHRPERVDPLRSGWAKIKNRALHPGGCNSTSPALERALAYAAWSVVDFALVDAGKERIKPAPRPKRYRNAIERELAEDNRYYEWLKLSAEQAGEERVPSLDELWFRAKSAAYNRKLGAALVNGDDPALLTVTDEEIEAELPRFERRARP